MSAPAMSNFDDAEEMVETMLEHGSIKKAMRVFKETDASVNAKEAAKWYCEFMTLKILSGDFSAADAKLSPSGVVDAFWHCHILDTVGYSAFFKAIVPPLGPVVNHDAEKSQDDPAAIEARQEKTKEVYQTVFNEDCPLFEHEHKKRKIEREIVVIRNPFKISYCTLTGKSGEVDIGPDNTVGQLKILLRDKEGIAPDQQLRVIYAGKLLEDGRTMADYGLVDGSVVHIHLKLRAC